MNEDVTGPPNDVVARLTPEGLPLEFGGYRIIRLLGEGGMGTVYLAEQQHPRRAVALKIIKPGVVGKEVLRRFEREAELLGRLQHPAVAQIYEAGTADTTLGPRPYFAMEHIDGVPLRRFATDRALNTRQRLELLSKICDGVNHAHQRGVIHRDLKPANILVDGNGQPKILDFGIARVTESDVRATQQTSVGQIIGTLAYMSPEQVSGDPNRIDIRSDVYALGVILYELLAARLPLAVDGKPLHDVVQAIQGEEPPTLSAISRSYRGDIETIVAKALDKDRERRYASAAELAADLRRHLNDEPIVARPPSVAYQLNKFARRHTAIVVGVAAVFTVLVAGVAVSSYQAVRARRAEAAAQQRFNDVRTLAGTLLFDLHDAIRDLAGSIPARRLVLSKAQEYLEILSHESTDDLDLQRDLTVAYDRVGDLLGNPFFPNIGDTAAASANYQKGLAIAARLVDADPSDRIAQGERAALTSKLGDLAFAAGDVKTAISRHEEGLQLAMAAARLGPGDARSQEIEATIQQRLCSLRPAVGDTTGGIQACRASIDLLEPLVQKDPANRLLRRMTAVSYGALGNILRVTGKLPEALPALRRATETFKELSKADPTNADYLRQVANIAVYLAPTLAQSGDINGASVAYNDAITILTGLLPKETDDARLRSILGLSLRRYSSLLHGSGDQALAHTMMARSLEVQEPLVGRVNVAPTILNDYADSLLKAPYADLRDPRRALEVMIKVDQLSKGSNPIFLDTLAWAYYRTGNVAKAIETQKKALSLLAGGQQSGLRDEIEGGLAEFEKSSGAR